jgi:hypothetical protein
VALVSCIEHVEGYKVNNMMKRGKTFLGWLDCAATTSSFCFLW